MKRIITFRRRDENGFVVVAVLWILTALATLATIYAIYVSNAVTASRLHDDRIQGQSLMAAAIDLAVYHLSTVEDNARPPHGIFNFRLDGARVLTEFTTETARIDLNTAPKDLLAGLFVALGASRDNGEFFAERVIGWRTSAGEDSKETESYRVAGVPYDPRGGPFVHLGELWLVRGLPPQLVEAALPHLTVYSGQAGINVLAADPLAVAALPGFTPESLKTFLSARAASRPDGQPAISMLAAPAQSMINLSVSHTFRVTIRADLDNGRQVLGTAVIMIQVGEDEPFRVLSWADSTDGSSLYELPRAASR
jgi:general secretion pathway protein K